MRIELLRHGECDDGAWLRGRTDSVLSQRGWSQMQANWPSNTPDNLISSPALRCAEFVRSQIWPAESCGEFLFDSVWQERDFGLWDGLSYDSVQAQTPDLLQAYLNDPFNTEIPDAEPYKAFKTRINVAWQKILQRALADDLEQLLIVTHGGPIRLVLQSVLGIDDRQLFQLQIGYGCRLGFDVFATPDGPFCQLREMIQVEKMQEKA